MAITFSDTPNITPAGGQPSAPVMERVVDMAFTAGDTYVNPNGWDVTDELAAAYPGETVISGSAVMSNGGGTIRVFFITGGTTVNVRAFEVNAGAWREVPNGTNLSAHSPLSLPVRLQ